VIRKAGDSIEVPLELATWLADAVAQAAVWTDEAPVGGQP
jgi:hypothetical protein